MSISIVLLVKNFSANDVDIMVFEPCFSQKAPTKKDMNQEIFGSYRGKFPTVTQPMLFKNSAAFYKFKLQTPK